MSNGIRLSGILVSITCPTDERLKVNIDCSNLDNRSFMELSDRLQDLMLEIDAKYSDRAQLKRKLSGEFMGSRRRGIEIIKRKRVLRFSPIPNCYVNKVKNLKHTVYDELNFYAVSKIVLVEAGRFKRCLYILSKSGVSEYTRIVENCNKELEELNRKIEEFRKSDDFKAIVDLFEEYGVDTFPLSNDMKIESIKIQQIPIELADYVIREWEKRDPVVAKYISEMRSKIIKDSIETFKAKLKPILESLRNKKVSAKSLRRIKEDLEKIRKMSIDVGLDAVAETVVTPLIEVIEKPEKYDEVFGGKDLVGEIDARFESLLRRL